MSSFIDYLFVFIRWFHIDPNAQEYFPKFRGKSEDELRGMDYFIAFGCKGFGAINKIVENLNNESAAMESINFLKRVHKDQTNGFTKSMFDVSQSSVNYELECFP